MIRARRTEEVEDLVKVKEIEPLAKKLKFISFSLGQAKLNLIC